MEVQAVQISRELSGDLFDVWRQEMKLTILLLCSVALLAGCASRHPYMDKPVALGEPHWDCDSRNECSLVQGWEPSQLTPAGCVLHTIVTFGHIARECKKPKAGAQPDSTALPATEKTKKHSRGRPADD